MCHRDSNITKGMIAMRAVLSNMCSIFSRELGACEQRKKYIHNRAWHGSFLKTPYET